MTKAMPPMTMAALRMLVAAPPMSKINGWRAKTSATTKPHANRNAAPELATGRRIPAVNPPSIPEEYAQAR
jgi:hypothetical protein